MRAGMDLSDPRLFRGLIVGGKHGGEGGVSARKRKRIKPEILEDSRSNQKM